MDLLEAPVFWNLKKPSTEVLTPRLGLRERLISDSCEWLCKNLINFAFNCGLIGVIIAGVIIPFSGWEVKG